ncbi:hypothetical protein [Burkholderia cenocepacia]|uniref:hypothetical protein n=1 Tax=Burkholderia cenocepacia TaxID=95486 RepID=UPI002655C763|nr:hypothetical protein [Burkholderia cenocepacia]MDN7631677.1 hypothetical protein [Burkholderia cenocepacia]
MNPLEVIEAKRKHLARMANQSGASGELRAVAEMDNWVPRPKGKGLKTLLAALAETGVVIKATSFDAIALPENERVNFEDLGAVSAALSKMTFIEIKTANQERVRPGFTGFFFALTEGEIAASEALRERHCVALYNKLSNELLVTSVPEILARAKSMNWQVSVQLS